MTRKSYPRWIRDVSPGEGFEKIESDRADGLPDGVHTGGAWIDPDGKEVWKPLDGGNAHDGDHYATLEAECLEEMAGEIGFPRNWRVENRNGRRWLVRPKCIVFTPQTAIDFGMAGRGPFVENAIRALNAKGWEIGDEISLAFDPNIYEWFILDLSCAAKTYAKAAMWDDEWRVQRWLEANGHERLFKLRSAGRHQLTSLTIRDRYNLPRAWQWIYASPNRPLSLTWAHKLREIAKLVPGDYGKDRVHTWVVTDGPLPTEIIKDYELVLAWHRWETPSRKDLSHE